MTTTNVTYTPWGWTRDVKELAEGVWRVSTPSHGGLKLSTGAVGLPSPRTAGTPCTRRPSQRRTARSPSSGRCPASAKRPHERELALTVAGYFDRYAPALPASPRPSRRASTTTPSPSLGRPRHGPLPAVRHPH